MGDPTWELAMAASNCGLNFAPRISAMNSKERAKLVIVEIIRQAGGVLQNKTNLFKTFYHAHLLYAKKNPGYLSTWPIVKMPNGPGIDRFDLLLGELMTQGVLHSEEVRAGNYQAFKFTLTEHAFEGRLDVDAISAIAEAYQTVEGKSAHQVSYESHLHSRTWREADYGDELVIYCDPIPDEEFNARQERMKVIASALKAADASR